MDDNKIRELVQSFDTKQQAVREASWQQLRESGERVLPFFAEFFPRAKRFEARRDIAFHCIRYARVSDIAFNIGLVAANDKSTIVRYRGCCVLAYALRRDALPVLEKLTEHSDARSANNARAAIDAIESHNHHYFVDRAHSGKTFWEVLPGDVP